MIENGYGAETKTITGRQAYFAEGKEAARTPAFSTIEKYTEAFAAETCGAAPSGDSTFFQGAKREEGREEEECFSAFSLTTAFGAEGACAEEADCEASADYRSRGRIARSAPA